MEDDCSYRSVGHLLELMQDEFPRYHLWFGLVSIVKVQESGQGWVNLEYSCNGMSYLLNCFQLIGIVVAMHIYLDFS